MTLGDVMPITAGTDTLPTTGGLADNVAPGFADALADASREVSLYSGVDEGVDETASAAVPTGLGAAFLQGWLGIAASEGAPPDDAAEDGTDEGPTAAESDAHALDAAIAMLLTSPAPQPAQDTSQLALVGAAVTNQPEMPIATSSSAPALVGFDASAPGDTALQAVVGVAPHTATAGASVEPSASDHREGATEGERRPGAQHPSLTAERAWPPVDGPGAAPVGGEAAQSEPVHQVLSPTEIASGTAVTQRDAAEQGSGESRSSQAPAARDTTPTSAQAPLAAPRDDVSAAAGQSGSQTPGESRPDSQHHDAPRQAAAIADVRHVPGAAALAAVAHAWNPIAHTDIVAEASVQTSPVPADIGSALTAQLVQSMRAQLRQGGGEAVIHLQPEHFGQVTITVRVDRDVVSASVRAELPAVRQWLETQESVVRHSLAGQGLTLEHFAVHPDGEAPFNKQGQDQAGRRRRQSKPRPTDARFDVLV